VLPQKSTALHTFVSVKFEPLPEVTSEIWFTVYVLQASEAVGGVKAGEAGQVIVASAPALPITGACVSTTVIDCVLVAE
jgi:hypothetical protein